MTQQEIKQKAKTYAENKYPISPLDGPITSALTTGNQATAAYHFKAAYQQALADMQDGWIDVKDRLPELYQPCMFVVISNNHYDGKVYGGSYTGNSWGYAEFSTPGIGFKAELWQPLPPPKAAKDSDKE